MLSRSTFPGQKLLQALCAAGMVWVCSCGRGERKDATDTTHVQQFRALIVGDTAPAYSVKDLAGNMIAIQRGEPLTLVNVWATWCTSCREEMASLNALRAEYAPKDIRIVGVSVDESPTERVSRFARESHIAFTVAHDQDGVIQQRYRIAGVPSTFLIGSDGRVLWQHTGDIETEMASLRSAMSQAVTASGNTP
ncbi:MAG: TlpA disulfide reductase family protein [Gemmatimonadaceae bacterium]